MLTISLLVILVTMTHYKNMKTRLTKHAQASTTQKRLANKHTETQANPSKQTKVIWKLMHMKLINK